MILKEIEEQASLLTSEEKIKLVQSIMKMLRESSEDYTYLQLALAAEAVDPRYPGPLEAYEAAEQLQNLLEKVN